MAGVAGPLYARARWKTARFLGGLALGGAVGGLILALPVYLLGTVAGYLPLWLRLVLLAVVCVALGVADLRDRTPHVWRQVPQAFVRTLPPGLLGLVWGFDLGLLVTTQKTTSLIWVAGAAVLLVRPDLSALVLVSIATVAIAAVTVNTVTGLLPPERNVMAWLRYVRWASGALLLVLPVTLLVTGLPR